MQNTYTISYPEFEIHCIDKSDKDAILYNDIHAKILMLRYFPEGDYMKATGNFLSYRDLPWGEVYYRQFYGRCIMGLAKTYGNRQDVFKRLMEKLAGIRQKYGEVSYEFEVFRELKLCLGWNCKYESEVDAAGSIRVWIYSIFAEQDCCR